MVPPNFSPGDSTPNSANYEDAEWATNAFNSLTSDMHREAFKLYLSKPPEEYTAIENAVIAQLFEERADLFPIDPSGCESSYQGSRLSSVYSESVCDPGSPWHGQQQAGEHIPRFMGMASGSHSLPLQGKDANASRASTSIPTHAGGTVFSPVAHYIQSASQKHHHPPPNLGFPPSRISTPSSTGQSAGHTQQQQRQHGGAAFDDHNGTGRSGQSIFAPPTSSPLPQSSSPAAFGTFKPIGPMPSTNSPAARSRPGSQHQRSQSQQPQPQLNQSNEDHLQQRRQLSLQEHKQRLDNLAFALLYGDSNFRASEQLPNMTSAEDFALNRDAVQQAMDRHSAKSEELRVMWKNTMRQVVDNESEMKHREERLRQLMTAAAIFSRHSRCPRCGYCSGEGDSLLATERQSDEESEEEQSLL